MATIVHFDISADNLNRAKAFYETLFGWKISSMPGFPDYYEIKTTALDGTIGLAGGITKREDSQQTFITNFIGVSSIDETVIRLCERGGKIIRTKQTVPGYGYLAVCRDTEENTIGLFREDKNAL